MRETFLDIGVLSRALNVDEGTARDVSDLLMGERDPEELANARCWDTGSRSSFNRYPRNEADHVHNVLWCVDRTLDTHGVESIDGGEDCHVNDYYRRIVALYCNTGDSYALTIMYDTTERRFILQSWGSFVEHRNL